jgi:5S rRNA maturation endonuclease (ribonuclease M5)
MNKRLRETLRRTAKPIAAGEGFAKPFEARHNRLDEATASDRLSALVSQLNGEVDEGALVVVEGIRDERALRHLGFKGKAFKLCNTRKSLSSVLSEAEAHRKVVLLFDYDQKGRVLTAKVASMLQNKGMNVDTSYRKSIRAVTGGLFGHVEDLKRFTS